MIEICEKVSLQIVPFFVVQNDKSYNITPSQKHVFTVESRGVRRRTGDGIDSTRATTLRLLVAAEQ